MSNLVVRSVLRFLLDLTLLAIGCPFPPLNVLLCLTDPMGCRPPPPPLPPPSTVRSRWGTGKAEGRRPRLLPFLSRADLSSAL